MLLRVDFNKEIFQLLYHTIYQRVLKFGLSQNYTLTHIKERFAALVAGDERVSLLVKLNNIEVIGHCLITVQVNHLNVLYAAIEQIDSKDKEFTKECLDYIEAIPNITQILTTLDDSKYKAFRKKYEFEVQKVILTREVKHELSQE